jgi:Family of unknown function (DUF6962)
MASRILDLIVAELISLISLIHDGESILNPTVVFGDFHWMEPVTTLTDFLVALVCWYAFYRYTTMPVEERRSDTYLLFKSSFLVFAIGMTCAAWLGHGFQFYLNPTYKIVGWICATTGFLFLQLGSLQLIRKQLQPRLELWLKSFFFIEWATVLALILIPATSRFEINQINVVIALVGFVAPMHFVNLKRNKEVESRIVFIALAVSTLSGLVYKNQFSVNMWFNYHDISHVLAAIFMFLMFRATYSLSLQRI